MDSKLDLLDVVLTSAGAENLIQLFKYYSIEVEDLKLLSEDDLLVMDIEDQELRKTILKHCNELHINTPERTSLVLDKHYIRNVLENIDKQLIFNYANLYMAACRDDIAVHNVEIGKASLGLHNSFKDLRREVEVIKRKVNKASSIKARHVFISLSSVFIIFGLYKFLHK